jgi:SAM-dependent methyltransferase
MLGEDEQRERRRRERRHFEQLVRSGEEIYWAERSAVATRRRQLRTRRLVNRALPGDGKGRLVLDVGCGTASYTQWLARWTHATVVASDLTPALLEKAREAVPGNVHLAGADAARLPFADGVFDAVVGNAILHHLPLDRAVPEMLRVLRPGGRLCFAEPNLANPHVLLMLKIGWLRRRAHVTPDETAFLRWRLRPTLEALGLHRVTIRPFDFLYPLIPGALVGAAEWMGRALENTPLVREIAGSLLICGEKPAAGSAAG